MRRRLLVGTLSATVFVLVVLAVPLGLVHAHQERDRITAGVQHDALALTLRVHDPLVDDDAAELRRLVDAFARDTGGRAVVVDARGVLLADSDPRGEGERDFTSRPEIAAALAGREVRGSRHSGTLRTDLFYVAAPVVVDGTVRGAVRVTFPMSYVESHILRTWLLLGAGGLIVLVIVFVGGWSFAAWTTRPLRGIEQAARRLGAGDLTARAPVPDAPPELQALARSFNRTAARLGGLVDSQRAFVADASHQLRTPLTALRLRLESLDRLLHDDGAPARGSQPAGGRTDAPSTDPAADIAADIAGARTEVERLSRLVDGLLALARAEERVATPVALDVGPLVTERCEAWAALYAESGVELAAAVGSGLRILATPGSPEQVLDNLISNALAVAPGGSEVSVTARAVDGGVEVVVADRGPGMTEEQRARAFDRFWSTAASGRAANRGATGGGPGGAGLGLAIVARLVESDGGEVRIGSRPGGGTEVVVLWPRGRGGDGTPAGSSVAVAGSGTG
ncbi:MAG: HAMP domain-containing histidine kinase [Acidimicrobiia bacterium]|nr:HAMP domain-containing histidine kinase [Acidimicrobiia bacterium]